MINRAVFREIYKELPDVLMLEDILYKPIIDTYDFCNRLHSKIFRMNYIYKIVDKYGSVVPFRMNHAQHLLHAHKLLYNRIIIVKGRQTGITTYSIVDSLDEVLTRPVFNAGIVAHIEDSSTEFLRIAKTIKSNIEPEVLEFFKVKAVKDNKTQLGFNNGSFLTVSTSFRSGTLHRLHVSEFGPLADMYPSRAEEILTGTLNAIHSTMPVIIESTARGDNLFKRIFYKYHELPEDERTERDFTTLFVSWLDDDTAVLERGKIVLTDMDKSYFASLELLLSRKIPENKKRFWIATRRSLGDDNYRMLQEYPSTAYEAFSKTSNHSYYGHYITKYIEGQNRILNNLYNVLYPLYVAVDLGIRDSTVLIFFQYIDKHFRVIRDYHNTGYDIKHYIDTIFTYFKEVNTIFLPHDATRKNLTSLDTVSDIVNSLHHDVVLLKRYDVSLGIEHVRNALPRMYIDTKCQYTLSCLKNYSEKIDRRSKLGSGKPLHDEFSDGADAIRYMVSSEPFLEDKQRHEIESEADEQESNDFWI